MFATRNAALLAKEIAALRELVELKIVFERSLTDEKILARDKANDLAYVTILKHVNDFEALKTSLFSRSDHEIFARQMIADVEKAKEALAIRLEETRQSLVESQKPKWHVWVPVAGLLITIFIAATTVMWYVTGLSIKPLQTDITHLSDRDQATTDQLKLTNDRIDRLYDLYRDLAQKEILHPPISRPAR